MKKSDSDGIQEEQTIKGSGLWIDAKRLPTRLAQRKKEPTVAMARLTTENDALKLRLAELAQCDRET